MDRAETAALTAAARKRTRLLEVKIRHEAWMRDTPAA
jgi:hypothetical protein